ncbi:MAG: hypothetical protein ACKPKO_57350, partial [Candidatus Fonsibacter sp.]
FLNGSCIKGYDCVVSRHDQFGVEIISNANRRQNDIDKEKESAASPERGRSPSRGNRGSRWKQKQVT